MNIISNKGDFMKTEVFIFLFMMLNFTSVFCVNVLENPVNVQEIDLRNIDDIVFNYNSENITLFKNNTDLLIIKEYMSKDNKDYYAKITNSKNKLVIEAGRRPMFSIFKARIEIYIPVSNKNITIRTSSGEIEGNEEYTAQTINIESSSGNILVSNVTAGTVNFKASSGSIRCKTANGNTGIHTRSGDIVFGMINGNVSAEAASGSIKLGSVNGNAGIQTSSGDVTLDSISGNISAESSSGKIKLGSVNGAIVAAASSGEIHCTVTENAGDILITSSSGNVELNMPINSAFKFFSKTSSGSLRTPFNDKLFSPISDKDSVQGVINGNASENQNLKNININTKSGSIRINWAS
jgi:DUF4097 and DUF4098 domain-containing protein YvlB